MVCNGGFYIFNLIDNALSGYPLLFVCLAEVVVICYVYGEFCVSQNCENISLQLKYVKWFAQPLNLLLSNSEHEKLFCK
ncbi:unnamed protein product [Dibothriocephalus latus]|uniref:Uncharacterized protein n=1 Tax=Dibothriocephalus latus TaxID=60516 RepID=A0A3P7NVI6_DIBLA|nr:unnamed protein product [Dibothriocephalus latus]